MEYNTDLADFICFFEDSLYRLNLLSYHPYMSDEFYFTLLSYWEKTETDSI